jgi:hypothetical protein
MICSCAPALFHGSCPEKQGGDPAGHQVAHFGEAGGTAGRRPLFTRSPST